MTTTSEDFLAHYVTAEGDIFELTEELANFLEHAGVKGMKWGVRKAETSVAKPATRMSLDAHKAQQAKAKAKASGLNSLSNKELKSLIERHNLEQQHAKLNPSKSDKAKKLLIEVLEKEGKTQVSKYVSKAANAAIGAGVTALVSRGAASGVARVAASSASKGIPRFPVI